MGDRVIPPPRFPGTAGRERERGGPAGSPPRAVPALPLCRVGARGGAGGERRSGAGEARRGWRAVPKSRRGFGFVCCFFIFPIFVFHLSLWGLFSRSGDSRKAAAKGGIPAGPRRVCPPPVWWRGRGLRAPRGERRPWVCGEVLGVPPGLSFPGEVLCPGCRASADPRGDRGCTATACAASSSALRPGLGCSLRGR